MKKELLLQRKRKVKNDMIWYVRGIISDDDISKFSEAQLVILDGILKKAEQYREKHCPFFAVSATEVLQKSTGAIALFDNCGNVKNVSEEYILAGASAKIYQSYKRLMSNNAKIRK